MARFRKARAASSSTGNTTATNVLDSLRPSRPALFSSANTFPSRPRPACREAACFRPSGQPAQLVTHEPQGFSAPPQLTAADPQPRLRLCFAPLLVHLRVNRAGKVHRGDKPTAPCGGCTVGVAVHLHDRLGAFREVYLRAAAPGRAAVFRQGWRRGRHPRFNLQPPCYY